MHFYSAGLYSATNELSQQLLSEQMSLVCSWTWPTKCLASAFSRKTVPCTRHLDSEATIAVVCQSAQNIKSSTVKQSHGW